MALLTVEEVHKTYREGKILTAALSGVSLAVEAGEFTALVGPSGSGKTTLLNLLSGLDSPDRGTITLRDVDLTRLTQRGLCDLRLKSYGFVFQSHNLIPVLSAVENVEYVLLLQGEKAARRRVRAVAVLEELGLGELIHKRPLEMSGGQQQRVAVARAIVSEPELVLADEPTANLDSQTSGNLLDVMRSMNEKKGITFIFSTHDPRVVERARRTITLKDGLIADDGKS